MTYLIARILETTRYVSDNSEQVRIDDSAIERFCHNAPVTSSTNWLAEAPFPLESLSEQERVQLTVAFNALSFSYWGEPYWQVTHNGVTYQRGSWSLLASLFRSREEGINLLDPAVQAAITHPDLEHILRGNRRIPLLDERVRIIREAGHVVSQKYGGDFRNMIATADHDAVNLVSLIAAELPGFTDTAHYNGQEIYFYKRVQALVESIGAFSSLARSEQLTALADYILPRKLRDLGILEYSDELAAAVDARQAIPAGSQYEVEIRASTIQAVERIRNIYFLYGKNIRSSLINDYLWLTGNTETSEFHRTRTTAY